MKILIIEDDIKNIALFKAVLGVNPTLKIFTEQNGKAALEKIEGSNFNLIILDIQLPGMNGIEICKKVRTLEKYKSTPIIAVTAFAMKGDKERILKAGFDNYISKPIKIKDFRETIMEYLNNS
jgi:two-component system cell cycle response regulator DivK